MPIILNGTTGITEPSAAAPAFSAYKSGATQDVGTGTWTKVLFETETFDTNSNYDTSNSRFTPTVAGYYQFNTTLRFDNNGQARISINKNGSAASNDGAWVINNIGVSLSTIMYANGTTDYFEIYTLNTAGYNVLAGISDTWFNGAMIRSA